MRFRTMLVMISGGLLNMVPVAHADSRAAQTLDAQGLALYQQGKLNEAGAAFHSACFLDSAEPLFQTHLALLLVKQNQYGELVSDFRTIARRAPSTPSPHYWLGRGLLLSRQPGYAEPELRTAVALAPGRWIYHYYLAAALQAEQKTKDAASEHAQADRLRLAEPRETP